MAWTLTDSILLTSDWQYTDPIAIGTFFRLKHTEAPNGGLFAIAQCEVNAEGKLALIDSQVLAVEKLITDVLRFPFPGCFGERRIAIKKLPRQPSLQQELRLLFLPGYLRPTEEEIRIVSRSNWTVEIEISDTVEAAIYLTPIQTKLDAISNKIDNLHIASGDTGSDTGSDTGGSTSSYFDLLMADNPYLYWRFGETSGAIATDSSINSRNGTYSNVILAQPSSLTTDSNNSITIDGTAGKVYSSQFPTLSPFTFGIRFKTADVSLGLVDFSNTPNPTGTYCPSLYLNSVGKLVFYTYGGGIKEVISTNSYNDNAWHSAVAVLSSAGMKLFVDGAIVGTNTNTATEIYAGYWVVGYSNKIAKHFKGSLDEFFVNSVALSDAKIASYHSTAIAQ